VGKGMPFRTAYKLTGELVAYCTDNDTVLDELPIEVYKSKSELFDEGIYDAIKLENCVARRVSLGGCGESSIKAQLEYVRNKISD
ncbi:MAG: argininosuccinate lyase, partial [Clostridia bacterium]|nr:argininosuccinate lyase [Clostridia bacterium]